MSIFVYMAKIIEITKITSRKQLDEALTKLPAQKKPIDLNKYFGKINFQQEGLDYQIKTRNEWR